MGMRRGAEFDTVDSCQPEQPPIQKSPQLLLGATWAL